MACGFRRSNASPPATAGRRTRDILPTSLPRHGGSCVVVTLRGEGRGVACDVPASRRTGVALVALQEGPGSPRLRHTAAPGWSAATTKWNCPAPADRQLSASPGSAASSCATSSDPHRRRQRRSRASARPGLAFTRQRGGPTGAALVVHLKAGCRSRDLECAVDGARMPRCRTSGRIRSPPIARCCATSCRRWKPGSMPRPCRLAVLGDCNRTLLREPWLTRRRTRRGSMAARPPDPLGPCTMAREGNRWIAAMRGAARAPCFPSSTTGIRRGRCVACAVRGYRNRRHHSQGIVGRLQHCRRAWRSDA